MSMKLGIWIVLSQDDELVNTEGCERGGGACHSTSPKWKDLVASMEGASKQVGRGMSGSWPNSDEGQQVTATSLRISVLKVCPIMVEC
jgi:hypothetical protein